MELSYAFIADAIETLPSGRFFVFGGGMEAVHSRELPSTVPTLAILAKFRLDRGEVDPEKEVTVTGFAPDGSAFTPPIGVTLAPVAHPENPDRPTYHVVAINFAVIKIAHYGKYQF